jgi:hypothetical protein
MVIESKFRKLFWIRIGIGVSLFLFILSFCIYALLNPDKTTKQGFSLAFVILFFLIFLSTSIFQIFSLKILENEIEKTSLIFRTKQHISFKSISSINIQKTRFRNTRGVDISEGFHYSILKLENGKSLIISPDNFENYTEVVEAIKSRIE